MTFLAPWALWGLLGLPFVVALHFLGPTPRRVTISSLTLWQGVTVGDRRRVFGRQIHHLVSLLLALTAWVALTLAAARPRIGFSSEGEGPVVLLIDARARTASTASGGGKERGIERAKREARAWVARAAPGREMALVVGTARGGYEVAGYTANPKRLTAAIERIVPADAGGDLGPVREIARAMAGARGGRVIEFGSGVDAPADNAAITGFGLAPIPNRPEWAELFVRVSHFGKSALDATLDIRVDNRLHDARRVKVEPGGEWSARLELPREQVEEEGPGRRVSVRLRIADALEADNEACAVLPDWRQVPVLMVGEGEPYLEKAIRSVPGIRFEMISSDRFERPMENAFPVIVFGERPPGMAALSEPVSGALWIRESPFLEGTLPPAVVGPVDRVEPEHPLTRLIEGGDWGIESAVGWKLPASGEEWRWDAPAWAGKVPLIVAGERKDGVRVVAWAFSPQASGLPFKVDFPLLVANAIRWLIHAESGFTPPAQVGESITLPQGVGVAADPDRGDPSEQVAFSGGEWVPVKAGFYRASVNGRLTWMAANMLDADESAVVTTESGETISRVPPGQGLRGEEWILLGIAMLVLCGEWWIFGSGRSP